MTRDEIRRLIGGYATGSLSEAERRILFEAALADQELFDELAREQALKEALEEPGAKARLAAALVLPKPWWKTSWVWAAATAATVVVIAGIVVMRPSAKVEQVAGLEVPELPVPPSPLPALQTAPSLAPPSVAEPSARRAVAAPRVATGIPEAAPQAARKANAEVSAAPEPQPPKEAPAAAPVAVPAPPEIAAQAPQIAIPGAQAFAQGGPAAGTGTLAAPLQPVAPAPAPAAGGGGRGGGRGGRGGGGGGGGRGIGGFGGGIGNGVAGGARALAQPQVAVPARFAFDYAVTPENVLRITPAANGFLSVAVNNPTGPATLFSGRAVQAGSVTEVALPADSVMVSVVFSAQANPTGLAAAITSSTDPLSGTRFDPNPSPNSVLYAVIPLKR
jgi:hypothetical protein